MFQESLSEHDFRIQILVNMYHYICDDTAEKLISSLIRQVKGCYDGDFPIFLAIGESGLEITERIRKELDLDRKLFQVCYIDRDRCKVREITPFMINGKRILICDSSIHTGDSVAIVRKYLLSRKAKEVKVLSLVVKRNSHRS